MPFHIHADLFHRHLPHHFVSNFVLINIQLITPYFSYRFSIAESRNMFSKGSFPICLHPIRNKTQSKPTDGDAQSLNN